MNQRVNIQYSVKIHELEREVSRLITKAFDQLNSLAESGVPEHPLSLQTVEQIDLIRQQLADADYMLQDTHNIILGYLNYKTQPAPTPSAETPEGAELPPQILTELQDKITKFKEVAEASNAHEVTD